MKEVVLTNKAVLSTFRSPSTAILRPRSNHALLLYFALLKETHFQNKQVELMKEVVMSKFKSPSKALNISRPQSNQVLLPHFLFSKKLIFKIN